VWFTGADQDGKRKRPNGCASPLTVEAFTRDQDGGGWGYYLSFVIRWGIKELGQPPACCPAMAGEYRATLLNMGPAHCHDTPRSQPANPYLQTPQRLRNSPSCTDRIGWHGHAFVLPRETIGDGAERIVFQSDNA